MKPLLDDFTKEAVKAYPDKLLGIILFGSYARGDFRADSDVDIILLFDSKDFRGVRETERMLDYTTDILVDKGVDINMIPTNDILFETSFPFYWNTQKEGVWLWKK